MDPKQDTAIAILRGLAICAMVPANMAADVLRDPHPFSLRAFCSFAAPTFILLSGMMVAASARRKQRGMWHFAQRGAMLLVVAVLVDLYSGVTPFDKFDVLYLIGVATPLTYLSLRLSIPLRCALTAAVFAAAPLLQSAFGYAVNLRAETALHHFFIDGWFPLFPWLGFALGGGVLAELRWPGPSPRSFASKGCALLGLGATLGGTAVFALFPGPLFVRHGYSELFYPPTIGFILTALGAFFSVFSLVDRRPAAAAWSPIAALGEASLFMYVAHLIIIGSILVPMGMEHSLPLFAIIALGVIAALTLLAYALRWLKQVWPNRPYAVRFLLGA